MSVDRYQLRGVSADKQDVHEAIKDMDKGLFPNAFCKVLPDIVGNDSNYVNIMHADTAGTKTSLAYIYWKETGDLSVWEGVVQDALVMNIDDMACVGCLQDIIISSTVGRNGSIIPKQVVSAVIQGAQKFIASMDSHGIKMHHSGGETADVGDIVRTIDIGFTTFGRIQKENLIINDIKPGNVIVGFASHGKATYENEYNGGMGSNGLTSARHDVFGRIYAEKYPESFNPNIPMEVVYSGSRKLTDTIDINGELISIGKLVLSPTRTYLPILNKLLSEKAIKNSISGMIHCSGGAQTKVLKFIDGVHVIKDNMFDIPPLFSLIQSESNTEWREMYKVFNMGHRLEIYCDESQAQAIIDISKSFNVDAQIIGRVEAATQASVTVKSAYGEYNYAE